MSKGEHTRQLIVSRALAMAHRVGLEQVTLGSLANELDLSKSGLFAHFESKEALQLEVIAEVVAQFTRTVVLPALGMSRGSERASTLFKGYLRWIHGRPQSESGTTGCMFVALTYEYDDRPGPIRDAVLAAQREWLDALARVAKSAVDYGMFSPHVDPRQFAFDFEGIIMSYQFALKVARSRAAEPMARRAFTELLARCTAR